MTSFIVPSRLYAILDAEIAARAGWTLTDLAVAYLAGGATFLQVRAKQATGVWLLEAAERIVALGRQAGATVIVNDRADIARIAGAAGVHLGQDDLPPAGARAILGDGPIVGWSTHTPEQIETGLTQPISYLAIGPVFGSATKATGYDAVGLAAVRLAVGQSRARGLPVVAIGGITLESAMSPIEAGAAAVAVISDLLSTGDPEARVRTYLRLLMSAV